MNSELTKHLEQIGHSCRRHGVVRLFAFGSAATAGFDPSASDMNFYVEFGIPPTGSRADQYFGLLFDLERAVGRPVDLVEVGAIRNRYVLESVERSKVPLYAPA